MPGELFEVLAEGQRRGLIGEGPLAPHVAHAVALGRVAFSAAGGALAGRALDLGSGGGLPGLVLALNWSEAAWVLLDSRQRSTTFLGEAVERLDLGDRARVVLARAEDAGRSDEHRGAYVLVTARGFGPPGVTAECAAPLMQVGGRLVVSEPPGSGGERWDAAGLAQLGLQLRHAAGKEPGTFVVLEQVAACPPAYPRRAGVPAKRPLF